MTKHTFIRIGAAAVLALAATAGMAPLAMAQDQIYGSERMTQQERDEYRNRMGAMKTEQEREAYRLEHRKRMQERDRIHDKGMQRQDGQILKPGMGGGPGKGK